MLAELGASSPNEFLANALAADAVSRPGSRFASLGAGNCDTEVAVAKLLVERGVRDFRIECVEINPAMLERGRALCEAEGVADLVETVHGDFNSWRPPHSYHGIIANQSLHHVVELEDLFDAVFEHLEAGAPFVINDMIGRNGHLRWPEALDAVQTFWQELPESYRYNQQLHRMEPEFDDWDCSQYGFEGVRSQDILPLLLERFHFEDFLGFGNVVDPFIDRSFGHNFDADGSWDRSFIDRVHAFDEAGLASGQLTPTHMFAVVRTEPVSTPRCVRGLTPAASVRRP
jgi:hypothetical protein